MEQACRILEIARSSYYDWLGHKPKKQEDRNRPLRQALITLHEKYPAPGLNSLYHML